MLIEPEVIQKGVAAGWRMVGGRGGGCVGLGVRGALRGEPFWGELAEGDCLRS